MDARELQRFIRFVTVAESGCWVWSGRLDERGYARFDVKVGGVWRGRLASRCAYEHFVAPLGDLCACHRCDNPACVNPEHIFAGTRTDNARDCVAKGRHWEQAISSCPRGHAYTPDNTRVSKAGCRSCKTCDRQRKAASRAALKAAT